MNIYGHRHVLALLLKAAARKALNGDSNPDLCDAGAVLSQLSHQLVNYNYTGIAKVRVSISVQVSVFFFSFLSLMIIKAELKH